MKKLLFSALSLVFLAASSLGVYGADSTFESVVDTYSPNHICKQLGTKVCHFEDCTVGFGANTERPTVITTVITGCKPTTEATTKREVTTEATTATEATTKREVTTEAATATEATTKREVTTEATTATEATTKREITTEATTATEATTKTETTTQATTKETTTEAATKTETTTETTTKRETTTETTTASQSLTGSYAQQILTLVNAERTQRGIAPLTLSSSVSRVAQVKAEDMKNNNYFSHTSPTYGSPFDMLRQFGVSYKTAGENIAKGQKTPQAVVNAWMNSEGHRANILNKSFTQLGVGYTEGSSPYWVQMFIG